MRSIIVFLMTRRPVKAVKNRTCDQRFWFPEHCVGCQFRFFSDLWFFFWFFFVSSLKKNQKSWFVGFGACISALWLVYNFPRTPSPLLPAYDNPSIMHEAHSADLATRGRECRRESHFIEPALFPLSFATDPSLRQTRYWHWKEVLERTVYAFGEFSFHSPQLSTEISQGKGEMSVKVSCFGLRLCKPTNFLPEHFSFTFFTCRDV